MTLRARSLGVVFVLGLALASCKRAPDGASSGASASASAPAIVIRPASAAGDSGAPRPGMAWIPPGTLRAGTPADRVPRVAEEEPAGVAVEMSGFYIDLLPYPNEPGAIPTSNVTRDEAERLCVAKGKRLCTELEWERSCKGPDNLPYEYGETYRAATCGTGVSSEEAARRPSGEHALCKSGFGVSDMHGGVWEWTDSGWGRGEKERNLGVLRGGNAVAGELVARCANAIGRPPAKKSPTMGLRCCAGAKNEAVVPLALKGSPGIAGVKSPEDLHEAWEPVLRPAIGTEANHFERAWKWSPVANEELVIILGCNKIGPPTCSVAVGRAGEGRAVLLASASAGNASPLPDLARVGDARHLRIRALDPAGTFGRDISYVYGRVAISEMKRP
ncbi:MAG: SUMF1/EgtB/PvdO family nonheme iron enzyme [Labilithrix sp.]|nr:SUMF1/EgtB/PvdO family nonheme iron enzyme [Labilithrix sp.]